MSDRFDSKIAKLFGKLNGCSNYAVTISADCTLYSCDEATVLERPEWVKHENIHKEQYRRYGSRLAFLIRYIWWNIIDRGYYRNRLEREARGELKL